MPLKLEDAHCAVCMDNLFDLRDDLDEVLPIATPDCGHVFHEKCLLQWFKFQADAYVTQLGDQGVTLTQADAPAECPECRSECYADPDTGDPAIHRLFINFNSEGKTLNQAPSSQHVPSSPSARWKSADKDIMGMARRARGLTAEVDAAGAESHEDDLRGTLKRAEALRADAVSSKAAEGFKTYVGRLNVALHRLQTRLEEHPLIGTLEGRVALLETQLAEAQRNHKRATADLERRMQMELDRMMVQERTRAEKEISRAANERDAMQREVEKTRTALARARSTASEREDDLQAKLVEAQRIAARETEERQILQKDLVDRTKTLKFWQAKAEKRGQLKSKYEALRVQNEALRAAARSSPQKTMRTSDDNLRVDCYEAGEPEETLELEVEEPTIESFLEGMGHDGRKRSATERVMVFDSPSPPKNRSTTLRTFNLDSLSPPRSALSRTRTSTSDTRTAKPRFGGAERGLSGSKARSGASSNINRSKYFERYPEPVASGSARDKVETVASSRERLAGSRDGPPRAERPRHPPADARSGRGDMAHQEQMAALREPLPLSHKSSSSSRVLVDSSSPVRAPKRSLEAIEVISLIDSPPKRGPLETRRSELRTVNSMNREPDILNYLGVNSHGEQRGVATGTKVRRRA
ncbi:hypothetical protein CC85DRAFT_289760 [Cutaneotrichosporon oleaginosum]|uniref:RING-type domain-containing protein n=1 Tax=Cutaneotrichosporon oleaginosum TaxID=879819 RepID=A0A0J0XZK3_9TREE|nr:uncharacterized protein CC85DRAFT_289760 [Cutaneotrichosporon oleaginosum]KLT46461.1 hypothetical protein CC85DRAFT_289760 [Cutaneotrichosporon oleaginosum]TXT15171.1 hypothetical protein COLE_01364 [Cutaneotrichosporon oleaginosum]